MPPVTSEAISGGIAMKLKPISIFLFLILAIPSYAQTTEQQIAKIRAVYTDTNKRIEAGLKDNTAGLHYASWTIGGERDGQQWSAVGTMKSVVEFYFDGEPNGGEEVTDARKIIRKIASTDTAAGKLRTLAEYLFDAKTGEMVFAHTTEYTDAEGEAPIERRFYYAAGKMVRVVSGGKNIDRGSIGTEDRKLAANAQSDAKRLQNIFALMLSE